MIIKFLKAMLVSAVLIIALSCSVYAEIEVSPDGNTISGYGIVTDDFDHIELMKETMISNYPSKDYTSDVLRYQGADFIYDNRDMFLAPGKGTDNSNALKVGIITGGSRNLRALTRSIAYRDANGQIIEAMNAVYTYDILIEEDPVSTYNNSNIFYIGFSKGLWGFNTSECAIFDMQIDNEGGFYFRPAGVSDGEKLYYEKNKWYTVELVHSAHYIKGSIMDRETGEVLLTNIKTKGSAVVYENFNTIYLNPSFAAQSDSGSKFDNNKGFVAYLDNLLINVFDENAPVEFVSSTLEDSAVDISRGGSVTITLSKPADSSKIILRDKNGSALPENSCEVKPIGMFKRQILFTRLLDKKSQYTIDLSELGLSNITFTTKAQYILACEYSGKVLSADKKSAYITYALKDDTGIRNVSYKLMGVLYKGGNMADACLITVSDAIMNEVRTDTLIFNEDIDDDATLYITFFENGVWIPLSASIECI